ncbi:MAG: ORF6N domain-containing protein [Acidobacteriota bacterium]
MAKRRAAATAVARLPVPLEVIQRRIHKIRGRRVMLDTELAELYKVPTSRLNEAVKRNQKRFPEDFMFQLTADEVESLISQNAIAKGGRGGRRTLPFAFTEHGVAMLSSVLSSQRAIQMNILIIRAFVKIRELLASHRHLAARVEKLEGTQRQHDSIISLLADEIDEMKRIPDAPKRRIGFRSGQ